jgi:hypothetical protein
VAGAVVVVVAVLAAAGYWFLGRRAQPGVPVSATTPAPPPPTQAAPPSTAVAVAPPSTEAAAPETLAAAPATTPTAIPEAVTVVRSPVPSPRVAAGPSAAPSGPAPKASPPGPRGGASPGAAASAAPNPAQQTAAAVASLMGQARAAADQHNYDAAVAMYDEVLKLEPQNAAATSGRTAAVSARTAASASRKTFVSGHTVVQTEQKGKADVSGFDSSDVVKRSPDFQGRLEFTMSPPNVKPGDNYRLQIALVNEGKKPIKISGMTFTITADGNKTGNPVAPKVKEVAPSQRVVLEELPGVFPEASTWVAEVLVTANKGDSLKNQLTWR